MSKVDTKKISMIEAAVLYGRYLERYWKALSEARATKDYTIFEEDLRYYARLPFNGQIVPVNSAKRMALFVTALRGADINDLAIITNMSANKVKETLDYMKAEQEQAISDMKDQETIRAGKNFVEQFDTAAGTVEGLLEIFNDIDDEDRQKLTAARDNPDHYRVVALVNRETGAIVAGALRPIDLTDGETFLLSKALPYRYMVRIHLADQLRNFKFQ